MWNKWLNFPTLSHPNYSFKEARAEKEYACLQCQQLISSSSTTWWRFRLFIFSFFFVQLRSLTSIRGSSTPTTTTSFCLQLSLPFLCLSCCTFCLVFALPSYLSLNLIVLLCVQEPIYTVRPYIHKHMFISAHLLVLPCCTLNRTLDLCRVHPITME